MSEINTVGELRKALEDYPDDMPVWHGGTVVEGGLTYFNRPDKYWVDVTECTETFGIALPNDKQRKETGVVIY